MFGWYILEARSWTLAGGCRKLLSLHYFNIQQCGTISDSIMLRLGTAVFYFYVSLSFISSMQNYWAHSPHRRLGSITCMLAFGSVVASPATAVDESETIVNTVPDVGYPRAWDWVNGKEAWQDDDDASTLALRSFFYQELGVVCSQKNAMEVADVARAVLSSFALQVDRCSIQWHDNLAAMNTSQLRHALSQVLPQGGATLRIRPRTLKPYARPSELMPFKGDFEDRRSRSGMLMERATQRCFEEAEDIVMEALYKDGLLAAFDRDFVEESIRQFLTSRSESSIGTNSITLRGLEIAAEAVATHVGLDLGTGNMPLEVHASLACVRLRTLAPKVAKIFESNNKTSHFQATCDVVMAYTRAVVQEGAQVGTVARAVETAAQDALRQQPLPPLPFGWFAPQKQTPPAQLNSWWSSYARKNPKVNSTSSSVNRLSKGALRLIDALLAIDEQTKSADHLHSPSADGRRKELRRRFYFASGSVHDCSFARQWANALELTVQPPDSPPDRHFNGTRSIGSKRDLVTFEHVQGRPGLCVVRWRDAAPNVDNLRNGRPSTTEASLHDSLTSSSSTLPLQFSDPKWVGNPPPRLQNDHHTPSRSTGNGSILGDDRGSSVAIVVPFHTNEFARVIEWLTTIWPRPSSSSQLKGDPSNPMAVRRLRCDVPVVFACSGDFLSIMAANNGEEGSSNSLIKALNEAFEPGCIDTNAVGIRSSVSHNYSSSSSTRSRSRGGVYLLSMHQAERLGHYDGAAATFFDLFPVLSPYFRAFQLMETDVVPLHENWAEKLETLVDGGREREGRRESRASSERIVENGRNRVSNNDSEDEDKHDKNELSGLFQAPCVDWWQIGSSALCNPSTTTGTSSAPLKNDFHLNGNALYALRCSAFDEYRTLVLRFYPARGGYGRGRCVEVGGCEAGVSDEAIGYDRALHDYRVHPLNFHYARHVHSKFAHFPEYALMNFCEDAVELDAIRSAYPHALMLHTKGYTRQSVGAREVHRLVVRIMQRPPTVEEVARYAPLWGNDHAAALPPQQQSSDTRWVRWLYDSFKGMMTPSSSQLSSVTAAKQALVLELCCSPDLPDRVTFDFWECSHNPKLASRISQLRAQVQPLHHIYRQLLNRPARGPTAQSLVQKWRSAGWWHSQRGAAIVQQICTNHEYLSAGSQYSFATGFRPTHAPECAHFCGTLSGYASGGAARACAAAFE